MDNSQHRRDCAGRAASEKGPRVARALMRRTEIERDKACLHSPEQEGQSNVAHTQQRQQPNVDAGVGGPVVVRPVGLEEKEACHDCILLHGPKPNRLLLMGPK